MSIENSFGRFFNDSDLNNVEDFINGVLSTPDIPKDNTSDQVSSNFLSDIFEKSEKGELDQLINQFGISSDRLLRYEAYDEIYRSVSMIKRVIKVYKTNIIQKNPVNGLWYLLRKTDYTKGKNIESEQTANLSKDYYDGVIDSFKILNYLKNLYIHNQLVYGNCFVEVIDLKKEKQAVDLKKLSVLNEISALEKEVYKYSVNTPTMIINEAITTLAESLFTINDSVEEEEETKEETNSNSDEKHLETNIRFKNVLLRTHKPHNILILETKYGTKLGYLEVSHDTNTSTNNITQTLSSITNRIISVTNERHQGGLVTSRDDILNRIINHILKKASSNNKAKFSPSVIDNLKRFVIEQNLHKQQINLKPIEVRFIPLNRMIDFNFPSSENYPYGGSIIEPLLLPGKLFILSQLSNIYMKLSRAPLNYSGLHQ